MGECSDHGVCFLREKGQDILFHVKMRVACGLHMSGDICPVLASGKEHVHPEWKGCASISVAVMRPY